MYCIRRHTTIVQQVEHNTNWRKPFHVLHRSSVPKLHACLAFKGLESTLPRRDSKMTVGRRQTDYDGERDMMTKKNQSVPWFYSYLGAIYGTNQPR